MNIVHHDLFWTVLHSRPVLAATNLVDRILVQYFLPDTKLGPAAAALKTAIKAVGDTDYLDNYRSVDRTVHQAAMIRGIYLKSPASEAAAGRLFSLETRYRAARRGVVECLRRARNDGAILPYTRNKTRLGLVVAMNRLNRTAETMRRSMTQKLEEVLDSGEVLKPPTREQHLMIKVEGVTPAQREDEYTRVEWFSDTINRLSQALTPSWIAPPSRVKNSSSVASIIAKRRGRQKLLMFPGKGGPRG